MQVRPASLARGRVKTLCRRGLDADAFRRALRSPLRDVVPFDAYCMNTADPATLDVTSSVGDGLTGAEAARLFAIEHAGQDLHPLRELFLPRGWLDELRAALVERGRCWGYLHLFRGTPFTPPAPDGWRRSRVMHPSADRHTPSSSQPRGPSPRTPRTERTRPP